MFHWTLFMGSLFIRGHRYQSFWKCLVILQILPQCHTCRMKFTLSHFQPDCCSWSEHKCQWQENLTENWPKPCTVPACYGSISGVEVILKCFLLCWLPWGCWWLLTQFALHYTKSNVISRIRARCWIAICRQWRKTIPVRWFRAPRLKRPQMGYFFSGFFSNFVYAINCYLRGKKDKMGDWGSGSATGHIVCGLGLLNLSNVRNGALLSQWDRSHEITVSSPCVQRNMDVVTDYSVKTTAIIVLQKYSHILRPGLHPETGRNNHHCHIPLSHCHWSNPADSTAASETTWEQNLLNHSRALFKTKSFPV